MHFFFVSYRQFKSEVPLDNGCAHTGSTHDTSLLCRISDAELERGKCHCEEGPLHPGWSRVAMNTPLAIVLVLLSAFHVSFAAAATTPKDELCTLAAALRIDDWDEPCGSNEPFPIATVLSVDWCCRKIQSAFPPALLHLTALTLLDLHENHFIGTIPSVISELRNLRVLRLHSNNFQGTIPQELTRLTALEELLLIANKLQGVIPSGFGALTALHSLYLSDNDLHGTIPPDVFQSTSIQGIAASGESFWGLFTSQHFSNENDC